VRAMTDAPASGSSAVAPFSFLGPDHPIAPRLERFRAEIASREHDRPGATVLADLTLRPDADAGLVLHRAYWSLQSSGPNGFRATTLDYHATRDRARWLEFPDDPELESLARLLGRIEVLRYIPLRRCTFRPWWEEDGRPAIAKVKRPHRTAAAWQILQATHAALGDGSAGFDVPAPAGHGTPHAMYLQTAAEGDDLCAVMDDGVLRRAGELHRAMHAADVPGIPPEDPAQELADLRDDAQWVAFALPEHADAVRAVMDVLEPRAPQATRVPAFCHGDLVPSQMLVGERWAITDFDGARIGDPHRDLAIWLASLTLDVPALRAAAESGNDAPIERAEAAYLDGYGPHDEQRLLWHRAAAEVHYAAVALKKDRYHPARLARGLRLARACAESLR
jgi:aminoglycoside phosphotransferase (APT) family kinase protein